MTASWRLRSISEVCRIQPPKSEARDKVSGSSLVSFLPMEQLGIDQKIVTAAQSRPLADVAGSYTYFADGDLLLAKITPCFENGKLGIAQGLENGIGFGSSEYIVLRPDATLTSEWLYYFLARDSFRAEGARRMTGAVGHKRVPKEFVENYQIPVPSIAEQRRIVAILDKAFESIAIARANAEKNLQNARELFERQLAETFSCSLQSWARASLASFCDVKHGFAFDGKEFSASVPAGKPLVITPGNFTEDGRLSFTDQNTKRFSGKVPQQFVFVRGDLVVVMTDLSSKMKILGKPAFVERDDVLHNQRIGKCVFLNDQIEPRFLYYFMLSEPFLQGIRASATGTMVKHTAPKRILSAVIPFPISREEQLEVVRGLDRLRGEIQSLESIYRRKLAALDELKQSLLHQAFSGKL